MNKIRKKYLLAISTINICSLTGLLGSLFISFNNRFENEVISTVVFWAGVLILISSVLIGFLVGRKFLTIALLHNAYMSKKSKKYHANALANPRWRFRVQEWDRELELFGFDVKTWLDYLVESKQV